LQIYHKLYQLSPIMNYHSNPIVSECLLKIRHTEKTKSGVWNTVWTVWAMGSTTTFLPPISVSFYVPYGEV